MHSSDNNQEIFNEAVSKFFGHNPSNPFLALIALYLRKKHQIEIVENYTGNPCDVIASIDDEDIIAPHGKEGEAPGNGKRRLSVIGNLSTNDRLRNIFNIFEEEAKPFSSKRTGNIFKLRTQREPISFLEFVSSLLNIDDRWFQENFNELFDNVVHRCYFMEAFGIYNQPSELTQLARYLIGDNVRKVYDPFAGIASFALAIPKGARYVGEEINPLVAAIGNLRIMANDIEGEVRYESSVNDKDFDSDIIVSTPPFHLRIKPGEFSGDTKYGRRNDACSFLMKKCLVKGKRGIITTTGSFNTDVLLRDCRKLLVDADFIDTIISLPSNIFDRTGVKTYLYVLNPDHTHKGTVRFVDASDLYISSGRKNKLKAGEIIPLLNNPDDRSVDVAIDEIKATDYILTPEFYLKPQIEVPEGASLMRLADLVEFVPPKRIRKERDEIEGEMLNLRNQDFANHLKIYRPGSGFIREVLPTLVNEIRQNCILIPSIMNIRKGIVVEPEGKTLFAASLWRQFIVRNEHLILPQYLVLQLYQPYFEKQIMSSALNVPRSMLLNASIFVPPLEQQRREIEQYQEALISKLDLKVSQGTTRREKMIEEELRVRRHAILNKLQNSLIGLQLLDDFVKEQEGRFDRNSEVVEGTEITVGGLVNQLHHDMHRIVDLADKLTEVESYGTAEIINISDFCNEYERNNRDFVGCNFSWPNNKDIDEGRENRDNLNIWFSKNDLTMIFENVIDNALRHGFGIKGKDASGLKSGSALGTIRIEFERTVLEDKTPVVAVRFLNNGKPLPSNMNTTSVFEWGKGGGENFGSGIGGWHIKRLAEHFGASVSVRNLDSHDRGFNVEYELIFPLHSKD